MPEREETKSSFNDQSITAAVNMNMAMAIPTSIGDLVDLVTLVDSVVDLAVDSVVKSLDFCNLSARKFKFSQLKDFSHS